MMIMTVAVTDQMEEDLEALTIIMMDEDKKKKIHITLILVQTHVALRSLRHYS